MNDFPSINIKISNDEYATDEMGQQWKLRRAVIGGGALPFMGGVIINDPGLRPRKPDNDERLTLPRHPLLTPRV